jgi:pantoate--beta-alanine ligase
MSNILTNTESFKKFHSSNTAPIGFVPTMGHLHSGHLSLLERSLNENQVSVLSIFVNPTQFSPDEDLSAYPRTVEEDIIKAQSLLSLYPGKELYFFIPENENVIYPEGFKDYISIDGLNNISEGSVRPSHFDGVATVVKRLFEIVKPNKAYFGKKDYQQYLLIKRLVEQESMDVEIIGMPIIREESGLAMSSRNSYLSKPELQEAITLNKTLNELALKLLKSGLEDTITELKNKLNDKRFNYLEIRNNDSFKEAVTSDTNFVILGNFQLGTTRLLDNIEVNK